LFKSFLYFFAARFESVFIAGAIILPLPVANFAAFLPPGPFLLAAMISRGVFAGGFLSCPHACLHACIQSNLAFIIAVRRSGCQGCFVSFFATSCKFFV